MSKRRLNICSPHNTKLCYERDELHLPGTLNILYLSRLLWDHILLLLSRADINIYCPGVAKYNDIATGAYKTLNHPKSRNVSLIAIINSHWQTSRLYSHIYNTLLLLHIRDISKMFACRHSRTIVLDSSCMYNHTL